MAKSKPLAKRPTPPTSTPTAVPLSSGMSDFLQNTALHSVLIFAFAFLLYANTLLHGFVQDDAIVITDNMFTTKGIEGIQGILTKDTFFGFFKEAGKETLVSGGRYRPLTLVVFAIFYQLFDGNPLPFHLLTVLAFAATCVVLYRTLRLVLAEKSADYAAGVSLCATLLFAAHPIHTEVVANIKGCDEIFTLLGSLGALFFVFKAYDTGKTALYSLLAACCFFLGLLSKENAAAFVVVAPLTLWFFRRPSAGAMVTAIAPLLGAFLVFFVLRGNILDWRFGAKPMELMNNPFLKLENNKWVDFSAGERLATIIYTLGLYIKLLIFPYPLTHDYYPRHIDIMTFAKPGVLLSLATYVFLLYYMVRGTAARNPLSFCIWFFLGTIFIVSNFIFPIGTNMGERFAFMPSVGFCLAVALGGAQLLGGEGGFNMEKRWVGFALGALLLIFGIKTVMRNFVWQSNETLFLTDVAVSGNSAKLLNSCGGTLYESSLKMKDEVLKGAELSKSLGFLNRAIKIHPTYKNAYLLRGNVYYYQRKYEEAIADFKTAIAIDPNYAEAKKNLGVVYRDYGKYNGEVLGNPGGALELLNESAKLNDTDAETIRLLGVANGYLGKHDEAIKWFTKIIEINPQNSFGWYDLGTAYFYKGDKEKAKAYQDKALQMNPKLLEERNKGKTSSQQ